MENLNNWQDYLQTLLENISEGVYFLDSDKKIFYWNKRAEEITGYKSAEVLGKSCADNLLLHIDDNGNILCNQNDKCPSKIALFSGKTYQGELYLRHRDGYRILVSIKTFPIYNKKKEPIGAIEIFTDNIPDALLNARIKELEKMALLDSLTKIANRRFIELQLNSRLNEFRRFGWVFGVLFIDIDWFKQVNDQYGHNVGDKVLKMVANTLVKNARSFDLVGRWGGEEFIVIIPNVNEEQLYAVAHKYKNLIALSSISHNSSSISVTVSIGASLTRSKDTLKSIIKRVDQLMYQSKKKGRNRVTVDFEIF